MIQWGTVSGEGRQVKKAVSIFAYKSIASYAVFVSPSMWHNESIMRYAAITAVKESSSGIIIGAYGLSNNDTLKEGLSWLTIGY